MSRGRMASSTKQKGRRRFKHHKSSASSEMHKQTKKGKKAKHRQH